jgi:hypothetical protein
MKSFIIAVANKSNHHPLHVHPSRHPSLSDLLCLINEAHVQQELRSTSDSTLKSRENPCVSVARVFAN